MAEILGTGTAINAISGSIAVTALEWPHAWLCEYAGSSTANCTSTLLAWPAWTTQAQMIRVATLWPQWVTARATDGSEVVLGAIPGEEPTAQTRRADAVRQESEDRETAENRALAALTEHLTEAQRAQLARDRFFVVRGSRGGLYRLWRGEHGRCERVLEGNHGRDVQEHLCVHPGYEYPDADGLLAVKLLLEADEPALRRIANITRVA